MPASDPTPLHEHPVVPGGFGRVSVSFRGRVMHYLAHGPFDAKLMEGAKRGAQMAAKRVPADRRYISLMELQGNLLVDAAGLQEFKETVHAIIVLDAVPMATVVLVAPGAEHTEMLQSFIEIWRLSRPVHVCTDSADAWQHVNAVLTAAGLPKQAPPSLRSKPPRP